MKNSILMLGLLIGTAGFAFGQEKQISGIVLGQDDKPLQNAVVKLNNTSQEAVTDNDGAFSIQITESISKPELAISYEGYLSKKIDVSNQENVKITLQPNPNDKVNGIDEVVIIAYGTQKRGKLPVLSEGWILKALNRPIARADQALTGQIAGVKTRSTTGKPGEALKSECVGRLRYRRVILRFM